MSKGTLSIKLSKEEPQASITTEKSDDTASINGSHSESSNTFKFNLVDGDSERLEDYEFVQKLKEVDGEMTVEILTTFENPD